MLPHEIVRLLEIGVLSADEALELAFCCDLPELFELAADGSADFVAETPKAA
ncbi:hypothetical protein [Aurantimonas sp. 22II-16-19i]|uniref:hypothetical protein n=1 Tax=Aurantimonas sp. 22II-16-19i TaxID=1317114 RepID=UPI00159399B1|nr:hypothetical protein [Aurantimonas sp. 22II-16-19i]